MDYKSKKLILLLTAVIFLVGFFWLIVFRERPEREFETKIYKSEKSLQAKTEETIESDIAGYCAKRRQEEKNLYSAQKLIETINNSTGTIELIGEAEETGEFLLIDIDGKNIKLECFDFGQRVVIQGQGRIEIGYSNFNNIKGQALGIKGGEGRIHHNRIIGAEKSGVFVELGSYEIYSNIIKDNLSYGVYGGVEAELDIHGNYIKNNGGYEVRLMKKREVYD